MNILHTESFRPQKMHNRTLLFGSTLKHGGHFDYWDQPLNMHMHVCYLRLQWSWTVLLPSDTHRKPIRSITAVLLPFTAYSLTLPCIYEVTYQASWLKWQHFQLVFRRGRPAQFTTEIPDTLTMVFYGDFPFLWSFQIPATA
jgi:hypothetical protein